MQPLLSYIAHINSPRAEHLAIREKLTKKGYPCVLSNDLNNGKEWPQCDRITGISVNQMRLSTLVNERNEFFLYFLEDSSNNPIANAELGIAMGCGLKHVIIIGTKRRHGMQLLEGIEGYETFEDFEMDQLNKI